MEGWGRELSGQIPIALYTNGMISRSVMAYRGL